MKKSKSKAAAIADKGVSSPVSLNSKSEPDQDGHSQYDIESAASDLMRAEKHKSDPKLMKKVHSHLNEQKNQISSIQDLKSMRNKMFTSKSGSMDSDGDGE